MYEIYRQKLQQAVPDGGLTKEDVKSLERLQVMLCIPRQTVEAAHADICGNLFEKEMAEKIERIELDFESRDKQFMELQGLHNSQLLLIAELSDKLEKTEEDYFYDLPYNTGYQIYVLRL